MNRHNGLWSSEVVTVATNAFALSMLATWGQTLAGYSFGFCMTVSWSFVVLASAMAAISRESLRAAALVGVGFAALYSGFVATVDFVQLTTVLHQSASAETLKLLSYNQLGSLACFHFKAYRPVADTFVQSAPALETPS